MISVKCDACGKTYSLKPEAAGQTFICQACGGQVDVPAGRQSESEQSVATASPTAAPTANQNFQALPSNTPSGGQQAALARVKLPATIMMVIAGISIATNLVAIIIGIISIITGANTGGYQGEEMVLGGVFYLVSGVLGVIGNAIILVGSLKMKSLKSYGFSLGAMILAMIPCNACCLITLPVSIWGLIVLNDANVKTAFKSTR